MENEKQGNDNLSKGKEMGQKAYDEAKDATGQAAKALKALFSDPIGGQLETLKELGKSNAMRAGIVLGVVFIISTYLLGHDIASIFQPYGGGGSGVYFKLIIFSVVPALVVFGLYYLIMKFISKDEEDISTAIYTTGVSVLPLALLFFWMVIFGYGNSTLLSVISIFCISTCILLINSSLQDIYKLSSQKSVLLTPAIIFITGLVSKLVLEVLL